MVVKNTSYLGAVPDGAIILFSGLGTNAQDQLVFYLMEFFSVLL